MSDPFSNWANKGWEKVREVGHKMQSQFHLSPEDHHTQQQHQEQQLKVDRVELSNEGKIPRAKVSNSHLEFVANFKNEHSNSDSSRNIGSNKKSSAERSEHQTSERKQSSKQDHSAQRKQPEGKAQEAHTSSDKTSSKTNTQKSVVEQASRVQAKEHATANQAPNESAKQSRPQPMERVVASNKPAQTIFEAQNIGKNIPEETLKEWNEAVRAYEEKFGSAHSIDNSRIIPSTTANSRPGGYVNLKNTPEHIRNAGQQAGASAHGSEHVVPRNTPEHTKSQPTARGLSDQVKSQPTARGLSEQVKSQPTSRSLSEQAKPSMHNSASHESQAPVETPQKSALTPRVIGGRIAFGGLSVMGIVGGAYEFKDGIQQLKSGKHLEGTLNTTAGVSDITSGTASLLYTFGKQNLGNFAAKVGGIGSITSGLAEGIDGFKNKDDEKKFEGSLKVTLGAGMLFSSTAAISTSGALGWGVGRFAGRNLGWGGETIDTKVTRFADGLINNEVNAELSAIQHKERELSGKALDLMGQNAQALNAKGVSKKDATEAIIGLRSMLEQERNAGHDTKELQANVKMMLEVRAQLKN